MNELVEPFLEEMKKKFSELDKHLETLTVDPTNKDSWEMLFSFFSFVRSISHFADFQRTYRLSTVALDEIKQYQNKTKQIDVLPRILMKLQRIRKIYTSALNLKREPRETDDDLIEKKEIKEQVSSGNMMQTVQMLTAKEKKIVQQEKSLDDREEQLVHWSQILFEQEESLRKRENKIFEGEKHNVTIQADLSEKMSELDKRQLQLEEQESVLDIEKKSISDLKKNVEDKDKNIKELSSNVKQLENKKEEFEYLLQKKDQQIFALEDRLASYVVDVERMSNQLQERERQQEETRQLLETKNKSLREMTENLCRLEEEVLQKTDMSQRLEKDLRSELQQTKQSLRDSENNLQSLQLHYSHLQEENDKTISENKGLKTDFDDTLSNFAVAKETLEKIVQEKSELELECNEVKRQIELLKDELANKTENLEKTEDELEDQKLLNEKSHLEISAAGWPFDVKVVQNGFIGLLEHQINQPALPTSVSFFNFIRKIRSKPLVLIKHYVDRLVRKKAKEYSKVFTLDLDVPEICVDQDAFFALQNIFSALIDNSFKFLISENQNDVVNITVAVQKEGSFLNISYHDNSPTFPFEKIRSAAVESGILLEDRANELSTEQILQLLFYHKLTFNTHSRGLLECASYLERAGGTIKANFENGLVYSFSVPVQYISDRVLLFETMGQSFAVPLNMVVETFAIKKGEFTQNNKLYNWKSQQIPVMIIPGLDLEKQQFGMILQAGVFTFLFPVEHINEPEEFAGFIEREFDKENPYFLPILTLEHTLKTLWVDMSFLLTLCPLNSFGGEKLIPKKSQEKKTNLPTKSFLIYRADPHTYGAITVDLIQKIETFNGVQIDGETEEPIFIFENKKILMKDSCKRKNFPYAQTVLLLPKYALAIQEVIDIVEAPSDVKDHLLYQGKRISVYKEE